MNTIDDLQRRTAQWFLDRTDPATGLVPDRSPRQPELSNPHPGSSIAAIGFGLPVYAIAAEHGWISRDEAVQRTVNTLRTLDGHDEHGFFYHFLMPDMGRGWGCELSSVDTTLLMGGVLFASSYWTGSGLEAEIRDRAEQLYAAVDWPWMCAGTDLVSMGWTPEQGFIDAYWRGYNEAMLVNLLALGSPTHAADDGLWQAWCRTYDRSWGDFEGVQHLGFGPMFGHQYSQMFVDFRGIQDDFCCDKGIDYFENSRRALHAQRAYAQHNPGGFAGYSEQLWGMTACDGPDGYCARGCGLIDHFDDGTLAPTAVAGSLPFDCDLVTETVEHLASGHATGVAAIDEGLHGPHGFADSFHVGREWLATDIIGIDQGPIVVMIENQRSDMVWQVMRGNPHLRRGLGRAGFRGGWLS